MAQQIRIQMMDHFQIFVLKGPYRGDSLSGTPFAMSIGNISR